MDAAGVDVAIVSLTSPNAYLGAADLSAEAARIMNDAFAETQATWPDRIRWYASLPWQHPELAAAELARAIANGAVGVMVIANIDGASLTDPLFAPVWQAIDAASLPVLVHPSAPPGVDRLDMATYSLVSSVGFTFDTTLAITRMMADGFFDRYTRLKIIAAHGGGTLPYIAGRLDRCWEQIPAMSAVGKDKPTAYLERLYLDAVVYTPSALNLCLETVGPDQVLYGSDYPHNIGDMAGCLARVEALSGDVAVRVRGGNATRLFGL
jgi:aminocarboxymuconate-semialdehyde decarboxylase